jgi:hypothetical protein
VLWIFVTHKNPPPSVGLEPATEYPVGSVASTLTTGLEKKNYHNVILEMLEMIVAETDMPKYDRSPGNPVDV